MKQAWNDLKSFITVSTIILLFVIVIANFMGFELQENLLILITNLVTIVFTYYLSKKENSSTDNKLDKTDNITESEDENND